ncbi:MAG: LURP-one-related family protein [Myxococcota bacterium]
MRFVVKQKMLSLGQDFTIRTEGGEVAYRIDGNLVGIGDHLSIDNAAGERVGRIDQVVISLVPSYRISIGGDHVATVRKKLFTVFRDRYVVDMTSGDDLDVTGDLLAHEYKIERHGEPIAHVSKAWLTLTDSYGVTVTDGEDPLLPLAAAIVIDMVIDDRQAAKS